MSTRSGSDAVNPTGSAAPGCSAGDEGRSGLGVAGDVCAAERAGDALGSPVSGRACKIGDPDCVQSGQPLQRHETKNCGTAAGGVCAA